jgi:hypothetical protein
MKALPYSIFKVVQGLCFPNNCKVLCLGDWDTSDWECSQTIVKELDIDTDIVVISIESKDLGFYLKRFNHIDYRFHLVIQSYEKENLKRQIEPFEMYSVIESCHIFIGVIVKSFGIQSFLRTKIEKETITGFDEPGFFLPEFDNQKWTQKGELVFFQSPETQIEFIVPLDFSLKRTSPDLLWMIENVLLSPWHKKYQTDWVPTRRPGNTPGLSFSGGVDSTAAMCLMPDQTLLFYMERDFKSMIDHTNAKRFISHLNTLGKEVVVTRSNHEKIRTFHQKNPGFSTDYACMAHLILLADYYDLDAAATGMPLENTYFFHGTKIRDFAKSGFWKQYAPLFSYLGIPIYQPVAGCSEILNNEIVIRSKLNNYAMSCLRSKKKGATCNECWKCFRKNIFNNLNWNMSPEISKFLSKRPLKQGIATLYALQLIQEKENQLPTEVNDLSNLIDEDLSFLNQYWKPSIELLPRKYRASTEHRLNKFTSPMTFDLYSLDKKFREILRGEV